MTAATADDDALDRGLANQARLAFTSINAMLQLEETFVAVRVHVIGDARPAQLYRFSQDSFERFMKASQLVA